MASVEDMNAVKAQVTRLEGIIAGLQTTMTNVTNMTSTHNNANAAVKQVEVYLKLELETIRNENKDQEDKIGALQNELLKKMVEGKDDGGHRKNSKFTTIRVPRNPRRATSATRVSFMLS